MTNGCIKEKYDNCGPSTEGEYCLFHKPEKNKEEAERFYRELKKRSNAKMEKEKDGKTRLIFEKSVDWKGYVFPEVPKGEEFSFNDSRFEKEAFFNECKFEKDIDFWSAEFERGAFFHRATFEEEAKFIYSKFKGVGDFSEAVFKKKTEFMLTTFEELAIFSDLKIEEEAGFDYASFEKECNFYNAQFKNKALFSNTTFRGRAILNSINFNDLSIFSEARFEGEVSFKNSKFFGKSDFGNASFLKDTFFTNIKFLGVTSFKNTNFKKSANFSESEFKEKTRFNETRFTGEITFDDAIFSKSASFENSHFENDASFRNMIFKRTPSLVEAQFDGDLSFKHTSFDQGVEIFENPDFSPENKYKQPKAEEEACRVQKLAYEEEGRRDDADEMLVCEMRARRKQKNPIVSSLEMIVADFTCKYGTSWKRILANSGTLILIFGFLYWLIPRIFNEGSLLISRTNEPISTFWTSLYFSTVNFTTVGSGSFDPTGYLRFLSGMEAVIGAVMIALLIAVFARKWMR